MDDPIEIPTKDITTKKLYLKRIINFIKRAYKEAQEQSHEIIENQKPFHHVFGQEEIIGLSLLNTTIWACKNWSKTITQESWRSYRAPLKFAAELYHQGEIIDDKVFNRINSVLDNTTGLPRKDVEIRTSRKKQKHLSIKDLKIIDSELSESKSIWSKSTRIWLRAGILTGLRPIEWRKSSLIKEDDDLLLRVVNAKNSNNRANGDIRHLNLNHLSSNEINIIRSHLKICEQFSESKDEWEGFYKGCSNLLRNKTRIAFPNRKRYPTLYSSRHQYSANSKASGCRPEELAALMGHASDLTAQMTYGKKVNGTRGRKPKMKGDEVKTVRKHKKTEKYFSFESTIKNKNKNKNGK